MHCQGVGRAGVDVAFIESRVLLLAALLLVALSKEICQRIFTVEIAEGGM